MKRRQLFLPFTSAATSSIDLPVVQNETVPKGDRGGLSRTMEEDRHVDGGTTLVSRGSKANKRELDIRRASSFSFFSSSPSSSSIPPLSSLPTFI